MSHSHPAGLLAAYNSLTDKHLAGYFNNTRIRRHLLRSGLITRNGRILSEKEYKLNIMKRDHQKYIRECLAQAIFHKVLDMERYHQLEIKKKLETLARKERIQRFKGENTRWTIENNMPILSPHPPLGPKTNRSHGVLVDEGHSCPITQTAPRPYTAPGNMQPPIPLQPLPRTPAVGTVPKGKKAVMKFRNSMDNPQAMNRYQFPTINHYMVPIPPSPPPPSGKITRENRPETWRKRRFRPTTAPNGLEPLFTRDSRRIHKTPLQSNAAITMIYLGKNVHLAHDHSDFRDEIKVYQQHCGGENLCVYKGKLLEKETFQFISKRHHGFPFSLTFFLNGIQVNRLSSCCEYKHRKGSRLGGKRGYFGFVCVERSSPCYKCIIAMGLDKKTTSPKPRKERSSEKREELKKGEGKLRRSKEYLTPRRRDKEGSKASASVIFSAQDLNAEVDEVRTAVEEMERKGKPGQDVWEVDQENIFKYEYEEDFEVDEEKQDEKANEEGQADDQMNGMSKSPSDDEKDHLDPEKESETLLRKAPDADDNVKDEGAGCSESELEEDKQDIKTASSTSSRSHQYSSCSEDESALGDREAHAENSPNESVRSSSSQELSENDEPGKSHLPIEDSLEIEIEDQEIIKTDAETKPLPIEENLENILEEDAEKGTRVIAEELSEKSREHVSKEEKEKDKSKLWEGSTAKVQDKKAGPRRVDEGVGQVTAEAVDPGRHCHCHYDSESGVSSADEGEKHSGRLETDTGAALNRNLVVEERAVLSSNKESKQAASAEYALEKKEAVQGDEVPQYRDADTEEKRAAALWGKAGVKEFPLGQWKPTAEQPAPGGSFTEEREIPQVIASGAEAEAEEVRRQDKEDLNPRGPEAARASGGLHESEALMQTVMTEMEKAASGEEQGSKCAQEAASLREARRLEEEESERAAMSEAGSAKPGMEDSEEEASTDLEDMALMEDAPSKREEGLEQAILGGKERAKERKVVMGSETSLNSLTSEKAEATRVGVLEDSLEELGKEDVEREEAEMDAESNEEDESKEILPEELGNRERRKAERPKTLPGETETEREEVRRAKAPQDEDTLEEEQKFKGEEGEPLKEIRPKEETQDPQNEMDRDSEDEAAGRASELTVDMGLQGEDSLREREVILFEAAPGFAKTLENGTVLKKQGGGEGLTAAGDTRHRGRAEQDEGPGPAGEGVIGAPKSQPAGKALTPEGPLLTAGEDRECADKGQDGLAGWEERDKEGPVQGPEAVAVPVMTLEDVPEGNSPKAGKLSQEERDEGPAEEADKEFTLGADVMTNGDTEGDRSVQGMVVAEEALHSGVAVEMEREALSDSKTAEGQTEANRASPLSDVAGEETWHKVDEMLGKTAAAKKMAGEEITQGREEATVTWAPEAEAEALGGASDLEGKAAQLGPATEGGDAETPREAESVGGKGSWDAGQESGATDEFRLRCSQERGSEQGRQSPQDTGTLPGNPDDTGGQAKQEHTALRESEKVDVF
uniref:Glutamate-rich protein 3 n=1 Tax=Sus scrofa TaxID=9823 RepID=A0A480ZJA5_PIG